MLKMATSRAECDEGSSDDSSLDGFVLTEEDERTAAERLEANLKRIQALQESDYSSESELSDIGVSEGEDESGGEDPIAVVDTGPDVWEKVIGVETEEKRPNKHTFREVTGPQNISRNVRTPVDFFYLFFNISLLQKICLESNIYFKQTCQKYDRDVAEGTKRKVFSFERERKWFEETGMMTMERLKALIGLLLNMCLVCKPAMKDYWNMKDKLQITPGFAAFFTRDRFFFILRFLHFNNNENAKKRGEAGYNPLFKVQPILTSLETSFAKYYTPDQNVAIDESLVGLKNRTSLMQYMPNKKHHRWGIKLWVLAESSTGYVYKLRVYTGKVLDQMKSAFGQGYAVVFTLMENLLGKGYTLVVDNFYTSIQLAKDLYARKTYLIGTLRRNRKGIPKVISDAKIPQPPGSVHARCRYLLMTSFREKKSVPKPVMVLSTTNIARNIEVRRRGKEVDVPETIDEYNRKMGGCDLADQKVYAYEDERRTYKWYMKVFANLMHRSLLNAYVIYSQMVAQRKEMSRGDPDFDPHSKEWKILSRVHFMKAVIKDLLGNHCDRTTGPRNSFPEPECKLQKLPKELSKNGKTTQREMACMVCTKRERKRKRSTFKCTSCSVGVCPACFEEHKRIKLN